MNESAAESATGQSIRAIVSMLIGVALLALNNGLIKSLTGSYPTGRLLFVRGLFVAPWIAVLAYRHDGIASLRVRSWRGQALRGASVVVGAFLFVSGLRLLPLADAVAVTFTGPLFITALAPLVLGERVGWRRWAAVLAGFLGALVAGAYYFQIEAFRLGEAAMVAPFKYTSMIWAVLIGFALFGDLPDAWTLLGAGCVIAAGLYNWRRETRRKRGGAGLG